MLTLSKKLTMRTRTRLLWLLTVGLLLSSVEGQTTADTTMASVSEATMATGTETTLTAGTETTMTTGEGTTMTTGTETAITTGTEATVTAGTETTVTAGTETTMATTTVGTSLTTSSTTNTETGTTGTPVATTTGMTSQTTEAPTGTTVTGQTATEGTTISSGTGTETGTTGATATNTATAVTETGTETTDTATPLPTGTADTTVSGEVSATDTTAPPATTSSDQNTCGVGTEVGSSGKCKCRFGYSNLQVDSNTATCEPKGNGISTAAVEFEYEDTSVTSTDQLMMDYIDELYTAFNGSLFDARYTIKNGARATQSLTADVDMVFSDNIQNDDITSTVETTLIEQPGVTSVNSVTVTVYDPCTDENVCPASEECVPEGNGYYTCNVSDDGLADWVIPVAAAGGALVLIIVGVVIFIVCRKKSSGTKTSVERGHRQDTSVYSNDPVYLQQGEHNTEYHKRPELLPGLDDD